jgi:hypothetical protein
MQILDELALVFTNFFRQLIALIPNMLLAILVLIVGYAIGRLVGATFRIFVGRVLNVDDWIKKKGLEHAIYGVRLSSLVEGIVKWFIYFVFIDIAVTIFAEPSLKGFTSRIVIWYPRLAIAIVLILLSLVFGEWLRQQVVGAETILSKELGALVKFGTVFLFLIVGLETAGVNVTVLLEVVRIMLLGVVLTVALILGIGIGLALKDEVRPYLRRFLEKRLGEKGEEE